MKKLNSLLILVLVSFVIGWSFSQFGFIQNFLKKIDVTIYDYSIKTRQIDQKSKKINDIIIIDVDEKSISELGKFSNWPRAYFAETVDYLSESGAKSIAFDMFFTEEEKISSRISDIYIKQLNKHSTQKIDSKSLARSLNTDPIFKHSLKESGKVILSAFDSFNSGEKTDIKLPKNMTSFPNTPHINFVKLDNPIIPIKQFVNSTYKIGFPHILPDKDGVMRSYSTFLNYNNRLYVNFSMQMVFDHFKVDSVSIQPTTVSLISGEELKLQIPIDSEGNTRLNYYGKAKTFRYISFSDLLNKKINASFFKGKYVIFGTSAIGLHDVKVTPIDENPYPGVELHATFIYSAMNNQFITELSSKQKLYVTFLIILLAVIIYKRFGMKLTVTLFVLFTSLIWSIISILFSDYSIYLNSGELLYYNAISFLSVIVYRYQTELKEKQKIKKTFSKYVSGSIVDEMLGNPDKLTIGGESKYVSALFTDIAGFTNISEAVEPNVLTEFLKVYMTELTQVIIDHNGMLDKYIGDAIVALFGVPMELKSHAEYSCRSALKMQTLSKKVSEEYGNDTFKGLITRIGINTGNIVTGNMGSEQLFDYTGIGDNMNLAARLEALNKYYGTEIMISENTKKEIGDTFITRELDSVAVKGKQNGVKVYELVDIASNKDTKRDKEISIYENALADYYLGNWNDALTQFQKVKFNPASKVMQTRCLQFLETPPKNWYGTWRMTSK